MEYQFKEIEKRWQAFWAKNNTFKTEDDSIKPKYYVLDMFPYPSGTGLHVGHPLGYIASDIIARYKRHKGFNVLHPMGYDSFGLPAEQYAIQTGQHPAITTEQNISRYRDQLDKMGFSFDWNREVRTSNPEYYKWTQWIFIQIYNSWYNKSSKKAEKISSLINEFENFGNNNVNAFCDESVKLFSAQEWKLFSEKEKSETLMAYRLAYLGEAYVNWCPSLGTVLANDEIKDGLSERGGYAVERKLMKQWSMRISAYAQRLIDDLDTIDWSESIKESQRYWIGKSEGTSLKFKIIDSNFDSENYIDVFTTRPDTIFGVTFITLAPENELVLKITSKEQKIEVEDYIIKTKNKSERERQSDVTKISGVFSGAYAENPFNGHKIPIWIGDYVLVGYGTGAVMSVPAHDSRDYAFAKHFNLPILEVVKGGDLSIESYDAKEGILINSNFLNGLPVKEAFNKAIEEIEKRFLGKRKTNYRLRDAVFGRQRYWGEPIPIYFKNGIPCELLENELPLVLPEVDKFLPTEDGEPPLARASDSWKKDGKYNYETTTMPGWAGSSWYFLRYMDSNNNSVFANKKLTDYWKQIDLYIGGSEHATGHLLYVRFWTKILYDLGLINIDEPAKKLINQGMIQGKSSFIYWLSPIISSSSDINQSNLSRIFISKSIADFIEKKDATIIDSTKKIISQKIKKEFPKIQDFIIEKISVLKSHVDVNIVSNDLLNINEFKKWRTEYTDADFIKEENGDFICGNEVEKMSKSKWNVVSPDDICDKFGADTLRLYEMFLGPLEQSKPWNTNGISGVSGFLKKLWRLFFQNNEIFISDDNPSKRELKTLHKTIKKITEDIERFSFNTSVSNFMICVNELSELKCNKRVILEPLLILISPYAPHISEELWNRIGHKESISLESFPIFQEEFLVNDLFNYPISFNGKVRLNIELPTNLTIEEIEKEVINREDVKKYLEDKVTKKIIIVPNKIVNIVI